MMACQKQTITMIERTVVRKAFVARVRPKTICLRVYSGAIDHVSQAHATISKRMRFILFIVFLE